MAPSMISGLTSISFSGPMQLLGKGIEFIAVGVLLVDLLEVCSW